MDETCFGLEGTRKVTSREAVSEMGRRHQTIYDKRGAYKGQELAEIGERQRYMEES